MAALHMFQDAQVYNYPVVNHGRVRGLLQRLRSRLLHLQGERSALQQQLIQLPVEPDDNQAPLRNRVCHMHLPQAQFVCAS